ncbi:DUF1039 domain-containing protein [Marivita sp. GX14005]|uniref:DUF1039 domain-containing protein n=1 Tax=Marivita sp. GX14005 TaxID=2942276 RepID=UPI00201845AF|nr:DUF1039 domain-containing protein [Marivita sp. GX14005]MCL3883301.1 DUF1039 domain-containing protein [Marivita sp. GX14005]
MPIGLDSDAVKVLADIGFLGISRGRPEEAARIFEALTLIRPDEEVGPVGLAMARLGAGDPAAARQALSQAPQTEAVMAFTCVALARQGDRAGAREIFEELDTIAPGSELTGIARAAACG